MFNNKLGHIKIQRPKEMMSYVLLFSYSPSLLDHLRANTFKSFSTTLKTRNLMQTELLLVRNQNMMSNIRKATVKAQELSMLKLSCPNNLPFGVQVLVLRNACADCNASMSI